MESQVSFILEFINDLSSFPDTGWVLIIQRSEKVQKPLKVFSNIEVGSIIYWVQNYNIGVQMLVKTSGTQTELQFEPFVSITRNTKVGTDLLIQDFH